MEERSRSASDAEAMIAAEVERFHQRQRTVNVAPAIVALQKQAEDLRQAELRRMQARLGSLTPEQVEAVEALTRGLVNKFLHPPMQALKQAARENNGARMEALCETYSLPAIPDPLLDPIIDPMPEKDTTGAPAAPASEDVSVKQASAGARR
jgi:glutamyl-tRNA reductase